MKTLILFMFVTAVKGQESETIYSDENEDATLVCSFRATSNIFSLLWKGPPYTNQLGLTYITNKDGVNPNTPLGDRLSLSGNHTAGEYNMKITRFHVSDAGRYRCEYGNQREVFELKLTVYVTFVNISARSVSATEGRISQNIECTTSQSDPPALVSWFILRKTSTYAIRIVNGTSSSYKNQQTISTLMYYGQSLDNDGSIYCNATNSEQTNEVQSTFAKLTVYYKPTKIKITPYFNPYIVYVGQTDVKIGCKAEDGNPPVLVSTWIFNGTQVSVNNLQLVVTKHSVGVYRCMVNNTVGENSRPLHILVQYGPEIQYLSPQSLLEGSTFVMNCQVQADPDPLSEHIWWTRKGDDSFNNIGSKYTINNIQRGQRDMYMCNAQNTVTPSGLAMVNLTSSRNVYIDVLFGPDSVEFIPVRKTYSLSEGESLPHISCISLCNPACNYTWQYPNGTKVSTSTLSLGIASNATNGTYTCTAQNQLAIAEEELHIFVHHLDGSKNVGVIAGAVVGSFLGVLVVVVVVFTYICIRRKQQCINNASNKPKDNDGSKQKYVDLQERENSPTYEGVNTNMHEYENQGLEINTSQDSGTERNEINAYEEISSRDANIIEQEQDYKDNAYAKAYEDIQEHHYLELSPPNPYAEI